MRTAGAWLSAPRGSIARAVDSTRTISSPARTDALGIVLMRGRIAEIDQNTVADEAGGKPFVMLHHADAGLAKARDHVAHVFRIELHRERGGIHHVAEHGGELTPLGADLRPDLRARRRVSGFSAVSAWNSADIAR